MPRIVFLTYDSRSGSTLLAKEVAARWPGVFVTPELSFQHLLSKGSAELCRLGSQALTELCVADDQLRNLALQTADIKTFTEKFLSASGPRFSVRRFIEELLILNCESIGVARPDVIVVKDGAHLLHWRAVRRHWGSSTAFIFAVRDPRAVVNSKLHTERPYYPHEVMAWGGPLVAALRWSQYESRWREARAHNVEVYTIRYESLIEHPEAELLRLVPCLGAPREHLEKSGLRYEVPDAEKRIHRYVHSPSMLNERGTAWELELDKGSRRVVEAVCRRGMREFAYTASQPSSVLADYLVILMAVPRALLLILKHTVYLLQIRNGRR